MRSRIQNKHALLLVNTGSPDAPTLSAVNAYLREFLSDPSIVRLPAWIWQPILRGIILPRRKHASSKRYQIIWTDTGSPLMTQTVAITNALQQVLGESWVVRYAMRYGAPSLGVGLQDLAKQCEDIYLMPIFAQHAEQTVGTIVKEAKREMQTYSQMALRVVPPWFEAEGYINALANSILKERNFKESHLLLSFHGIPMKGSEIYRQQVERTTRLLASRLGLDDTQFSLTYQSKFGFGTWLGPSTIDTVRQLALNDVRHVTVVCPGFGTDCLETLEEIDVDVRSAFMKAGGIGFHYVPCLNSSEEIVSFYADWIRKAGQFSKLLENVQA